MHVREIRTAPEREIEAQASLTTGWATAFARFLADPSSLLEASAPVELVVDFGEGLTVHQEVVLTVGGLRQAEGEAWVPIAWVSAGRTGIFPSFDGVLELRHGEEGDAPDDDARLRLFGTYTAPPGRAGRFGDAVRGRRVARRSLEALARELAARFDRRVARRTGALPGPVYPEVLRDRPEGPVVGDGGATPTIDS